MLFSLIGTHLQCVVCSFILTSSGKGKAAWTAFEFKEISEKSPAFGPKQAWTLAQLPDVAMYLCYGSSIEENYHSANRNVRVTGGRSLGAFHAKCIRVGEYLVVGSTNWTLSSLCNREMSILCRLDQEGIERFNVMWKSLRHNTGRLCGEELSRLQTLAGK